MYSPIRYCGGKLYARKLILPLLPLHTTYIEPFAGGASIFFAKNKAKNNILNDLDNELMCCYKAIQRMPKELSSLLEGCIADAATHKMYKEQDTSLLSELETAARYYYLNRTSFSGIMTKSKMYFAYDEVYSKHPRVWAKTIEEASLKLQNVQFLNLDFEHIIDSAPNDSLLFIDPPYYNVTKNLYKHEFEAIDHKRLYDCIIRNIGRLKIILTYNNCEYINNLFGASMTFLPMDWYYPCRKYDRKKIVAQSKHKESIFVNFEHQQLTLF
jgi:DNA adenine methylase